MGQKTKYKLNLGEIINSLGSLNEIGKKEGLEFKLNYRVAKNSRKLEPIVKAYRIALDKFYKENGTYDQSSGEYRIDLKDKALVLKFKETNDELLSEEHEIEFDLIPIDLFLNTTIEAQYIQKIFWMIDGDI